MPAQVIDGQAVAARILEELRAEAARLSGRGLTLASVQVGDNPASEL